MRMPIIIKYSRHGIHKGEQGAWFKGQLSDGRTPGRFFSYKTIESLLSKDPSAAADPDRKWHIFKTPKDGISVPEFVFTTKEFTKALANGCELAAHRLDREARRKISKAYLFDKTDIGVSSDGEKTQEIYAIFNNKTQTAMALTSDHIKGIIGDNRDACSDPRRLQFYFAYSNYGYFYAGNEVLKAELAFEKAKKGQPAFEIAC